MPLDPLATVVDLEGRLGRTLSDTEADRAELLLADASAAVRAYTGQQFGSATSTVRLKNRGGYVIVPQRPVTDVTGITDTAGGDVEYTWHAGGRVDITALSAGWVDVTYEHGYEEIPEEIVAVVCQIAGRSLGTAADKSGYSSETIGAYSYSVGAAAAAGTSGLLNDEKAVLDRYRLVGGTIWVGS